MKKPLKGAIRSLIRPFWRRIWAKIEERLAPIEARIQSLETDLGSLDVRLNRIEQGLGALEAGLGARVTALDERMRGGLEALEAGLGGRVAALDERMRGGLEALEAGLGGRVAALDERLGPIETGWRDHLPVFSNAASTVAALGRELVQMKSDLRQEIHQSAAALRVQLEPVEMRLGLRQDEVGDRADAPRYDTPSALPSNRNTALLASSTGALSRIRSPEKLAEMQAKGLRLNLGGGEALLDCYVNLGRQDLPGVDIVADIDDIPLSSGSVRELFSAHVLQHFPPEELRQRLLPYWRDLLEEGGKFRAVVPDGEAMLVGIVDGTYSLDDIRTALLGGDGCLHRSLFTPRRLTSLLEEAGFRDIEVPVAGRRNGTCLDFEIVGFKR